MKVAHFPHLPGAECWSEQESVTHLRAKRLLAERFRSRAYQVRLEEVHRRVGRRVDVAVTMPTGHRVAIEVQDSAIAVEEMKARTRLDRPTTCCTPVARAHADFADLQFTGA